MGEPESISLRHSALARWISPRRWRFWVIFILLAYTLGGFFGAPWLLERVATNKVAALDRTITFGDIKINPFLLTLQMLDTQMHDADGVLLFSYDDYFFDLQASSLFRWAWTFKEIRLAGLQVNAERFAPGDERFGRLLDSFPPSDESEPEPELTSQGLPRLVIQKLQVIDARLQIKDHLAHGTFDTALGPINVEIRNLSTLPDQSGQQQVQITTQAGGVISWQGSVQLSPLLSQGEVSVKGRVLDNLDHYLKLFTEAKVAGESVEWGFSYRIEQKARQDITISVSDFNARFDNWQLILPDEDVPFVDLPQLQITGASMQWPQHTLEIGDITMQQPQLRLVGAVDGELNLDRFLAQLEGAEVTDDSTGKTDSAEEWQMHLGHFGIEQGVMHYRDLSTDPALEVDLQDILLSVSDISNQPEASLPVEATFAVASGGSGRFEGQAVVLPEFMVSGQFGLDGLQLPVVQPLLKDIARVTLNSGSLNLNGQVAMSPQQPGSFQGAVVISELDVSDQRQNEKLTGWKQLSIDRVELDLAAGSVKTSELNLSQPYGRLQIAKDQTTNLDGLMIEPTDEQPAVSPVDQSAEPVITIAGLKITDASLDFSDLTLPLPFAAAMRSLDGTISTLASNSEAPARVELEGQVNEYGLARISGSLNAWDPTGFSDIQMTFRNLEMESMTPYTIEFAGWEIDAGRMDLDLDYEINKGQLNGANAIVIRELTVGDKVENPSGASLPLKFAVALLKDSEGVIDVDLPVEGDLDDPSFKIGGIVWKAIGNLLLKVVTAPFRLLGSLVGVDSEEFGTLHFNAGKAEISPPDKEQLVKLADAMRQRPELQLEVSGVYVAEVDKPALQAQLLDARIEVAVAALKSSDDSLSTEHRRQVMEQMLVSSVPDLDLLAMQQQFSSIPSGEDPEKATAVLDKTAYVEALRLRLIDAEPVTETELLTLAEARADAVMTTIAGEGGDSPLSVTRLPAAAVDAADNAEVPLELKVEAAPE